MTNHEEFRDINKLLSTINNKTKNAKTKALTCAFVRQVIGINIYFKQIRVCVSVCERDRERQIDRQCNWEEEREKEKGRECSQLNHISTSGKTQRIKNEHSKNTSEKSASQHWVYRITKEYIVRLSTLQYSSTKPI